MNNIIVKRIIINALYYEKEILTTK